MPPVVAAAGIGAASSIAGGIIGSKQASKASKANQDAQREALAYEREKDAQRKAEYDKAVEMYKSQQADWNANRRAILSRYGVHLPEQAAGAMGSPGGMVSGGMGNTPRVSLGDIAGAQPMPSGGGQMGAQAVPGAQPPGDAFDWQDWSHYAPIR